MELQGVLEFSQLQPQQQRQQSEQIISLLPLAEELVELVELLAIMEVIVIKGELKIVAAILSGIQIV